ncbi:MAG: UDP-N-acetylmuramoyl-L-alanine--D-glutamate ligase [Bacteroidetes bacterium HGW-Bacteroidetes-17]|jgi:UDP-N-acetylmuramoylalanine--D-glutamate ligase|nr:MAG: UDP-N-acetylmuramoyl-L-alanine--D-glutamate ligase [Bacteroidetes bacterium HGW-Bacteroidetes-17]
MIEKLRTLLNEKKILILGFGREGQSTYQLIRSFFPETPLTIADGNETHPEAKKVGASDQCVNIILGKSYLDEIFKHNLIFKSPGISLQNITLNPVTILSSQTQVFLEAYSPQTIGITGTKGKSTTSSLIYHILKEAGRDCMFVGNIGIPAFSATQNIKPETIIVYELSGHQLESVTVSPHIGILLNIFEEHLDHFGSFDRYIKSKTKIAEFQEQDDFLIINNDQPDLLNYLPKTLKSKILGFSLNPNLDTQCFVQNEIIYLIKNDTPTPIIKTNEIKNLLGKHNQYNIMASILACTEVGLSPIQIINGIKSFHSLEHRLEYVGFFKGIHFYNDSISTIPEATIEAVKSLTDTDTLILGGFDRGINYDHLIQFLVGSDVKNFIFMGPAGIRMKSILNKFKPSDKYVFESNSLEEAFVHVLTTTAKGKICLLSPAAASYNAFKNFEERGNLYKKIARNL